MKIGFLISDYPSFATHHRTPEMSHKMADMHAARDLCFSVLAIFSALVETNEQIRATSANSSDNTEMKRSVLSFDVPIYHIVQIKLV